MIDPLPPNMARLVTTIRQRTVALISGTLNRNIVVTLSGQPLGPLMNEEVLSPRPTLLTEEPVAVFGSYYKGLVRARNWQTGEQLWEKTGFKEIEGLSCSNVNNVLVCLMDGTCVSVDGRTGRKLETLAQVCSVAADPSSTQVVLMRGKSGTRGKASRRLEYRVGLSAKPVFSIPSDLEWFDQAPLGDGWLGIAETRCGGKLKVLDYSGKVLWEYRVPHTEDNLWCASATPDRQDLLIIVRDGGRIVDGHLDTLRPDMALIFDGLTGRLLREEALPSLVGREAALDGAVIVGFDDVLHVPSLKWESREYFLPSIAP